MERITRKDLECLTTIINETLKTPLAAYTETTKGYKGNIGHYRLDYAYGGVRLVQIVTEGGGIKIINTGFTSKRELYNWMTAFLDGIYTERR